MRSSGVNSVDYNHVLIVADSTRYDTVMRADAPFLKSLGRIRPALSHGTYTWPSHMAMMMGHLPHCPEDLPLYNRYRQQLWRLGDGRGTGGGQFQEWPFLLLPTEESLPEGFRKIGFTTVGTGAVSWFSHRIWRDWFDLFLYANDVNSQIEWFLNSISKSKRFFGFLNFKETHEPYSHGSVVYSMPDRYQEHKLSLGPLTAKDFSELHNRQIRALEYLDARIRYFCSRLPRNTVLAFTADHGECFGEENLFGHGFWHPKVMEVPLLIAFLDDLPG
jgi:arylsulfatase A-like enzyme